MLITSLFVVRWFSSHRQQCRLALCNFLYSSASSLRVFVKNPDSQTPPLEILIQKIPEGTQEYVFLTSVTSDSYGQAHLGNIDLGFMFSLLAAGEGFSPNFCLKFGQAEGNVLVKGRCQGEFPLDPKRKHSPMEEGEIRRGAITTRHRFPGLG